MKLNDNRVKSPPRGKIKLTPQKLVIPDELAKALKKNKLSNAAFKEFSYSNQKDYVLWITEAKTEATRSKRLKTAIEWMEEGKIRNWKYIKK